MSSPGSADNLELVGLAEISGLLGVPSATVASWRQRGLLPRPRWQLMAGPVWIAGEIRSWYEQERGGSGTSVVPDRVREAIDLSTEPQRAEVFAHYGLAMGEAQMVEQHLAAVVALLYPPPDTQRVFWQIIENAEKKTMGALKEELRKFGVPVIGAELLQRGVETRNLLAHRFFRDAERSVKMTTEAGRNELILELDEAARQFFMTAQYLRAAEVRLAMQRGASMNSVMQRVRHYQEGAAPIGPLAKRTQVLVTGSPEIEDVVKQAFDEVTPHDENGRPRQVSKRSKGARQS
jgi:hypothetical protein